jgi:hypothetical protein
MAVALLDTPLGEIAGFKFRLGYLKSTTGYCAVTDASRLLGLHSVAVAI